MKAGRIAEVGSYDELMACQGFFHEMQQLQH
jgi:ABC-type multidrug transport system fused ATPase/permease subunit